MVAIHSGLLQGESMGLVYERGHRALLLWGNLEPARAVEKMGLVQASMGENGDQTRAHS